MSEFFFIVVDGDEYNIRQAPERLLEVSVFGGKVGCLVRT